jgi:3-carboxy-cis,cis-muconate cycloisomerase
MPQKRNPIASLYIHSTASIVRQNVASLLDAMIEDHERSTGPWEIEWIVVPEIFLLTSGCLAQTRALVEGMTIDAARMRANLDLTKGLIVSEAVMMGLGPALGRQLAHDLVYDICREVVAGKGTFLDLLAEHPAIKPHADRAALAAMLDPANYTGLAGAMVDRVLAREPSVGEPR